MVTEPAIEIIMLLDKKWRGPSGHGWRYRAVYNDDPNGFVGYGDTLREARLDLQKRQRGAACGIIREICKIAPRVRVDSAGCRCGVCRFSDTRKTGACRPGPARVI